MAQPHFNIGAMQVKPFPLPPLAEQNEIVRRADVLRSGGQDRGPGCGGDGPGRTSTQSILARAFRGELVPTEAELRGRRAATMSRPPSCWSGSAPNGPRQNPAGPPRADASRAGRRDGPPPRFCGTPSGFDELPRRPPRVAAERQPWAVGLDAFSVPRHRHRRVAQGLAAIAAAVRL